jgi:osmotically-inducible protein OsmY
VRRHRNESEHIARTTATDLKMMAQDMLRMGTHWAQAAQDWLDQRREDVNERDTSRRRGTRSDRDIQSDFSGGGYDQVGRGTGYQASYASHYPPAGEGAPYTGARNYAQRGAQDRGVPGGAYGYQGRDEGATQSRSRGFRGVGPRNYTRTDERIREDLNERLTEADDIDARDVTVEVNNGVATLSGRVDQRWMKHRAEDLADSCSGVRDVRNHIQVGDESRATSASGSTSVGNSAGGASPGTATGAAAGTASPGTGNAAGTGSGTRSGTGTNSLQDTPSSSH